VTAPPKDASPDAEAASLEAELVAAERMIFFADAVVAIAITLLAIGLPLPHGVSNGQVLRSLWDHRAEYLVFLISFVVIGNYWAAHRRLFRYVVRLGGHLSGLNMAWLLMMVITPFATRVLSGDGGFAVRFTFYALVQVTAAVCLLLMAREIARYDLLRAGTPKSVTTRGQLPTLTIIAMFLVSIPVSFFTEWAYACWVAIPLVTRAARWLIARRHSAVPDGASG
jgi:uncharacterized membrane protein